MTRSDFPLCSWNSRAPLAGNTGLYLPISFCVRQTVRLTTEFVDWCIEHVHNVQTPVPDTSRCDHSDLKQRLIDTWEAYHKTSSLVNGDNDYLQAWDKGHHFEHLLN